MTACEEFDRLWDLRLDARGPVAPAAEAALDVHASACPGCGETHRRYLTLARAIGAPKAVPVVSADFANRVLESMERDSPRVPVFAIPRRRFVALAAAAAALIGVALGLGRFRELEKSRPVAEVASSRPHLLSEAFGDATSATWELAREASAPAARIGREVFVARESAVAGSPFSLAPAVDVHFSVPTPTGLLQGVGERFNAGVRPLPGAARQAFSFLIGPINSADPTAVSRSPGA